MLTLSVRYHLQYCASSAFRNLHQAMSRSSTMLRPRSSHKQSCVFLSYRRRYHACGYSCNRRTPVSWARRRSTRLVTAVKRATSEVDRAILGSRSTRKNERAAGGERTTGRMWIQSNCTIASSGRLTRAPWQPVINSQWRATALREPSS